MLCKIGKYRLMMREYLGPEVMFRVVKKVGCLGNFPEPTGNPYLYVRAGVLDTRHVQPGNVMVQKISAWLAG